MNNCGCAYLRSFVVAASLQRLCATAVKHPCFRREFGFLVVRGEGSAGLAVFAEVEIIGAAIPQS